MRLGAPVFYYENAQEWAKLHDKNGYGAAYWPLPLSAPASQVNEYVQAAHDYNLVISEVGAWNNTLDRAGKAEKNIMDTIQALRLADYIGAKCCINITGSWADTWDGPHPNNMTTETFDRVVTIIQHIIDTARPQKTFYTVEPMPWMIPNSIENLQKLLRCVDRPRFAVHADMCNLINSFEKVYSNAAYTKEFFQTFGESIKAVHAKDIALSKQLTLQISEVIPGRGLMDYDTLLLECAALEENVPVMAEHLTTQEEYCSATAFLQKKAKSLGIKLKTGREH